MSFFEHLGMAPSDPILGLTLAFAADERRDKVNLGAGVYKTADLKPYILTSVKEAERVLLKEETSKDYLPMAGDGDFIEQTKKLVLGEFTDDRIFAIQSIGGTGALKVGGELLLKSGCKRIFLSDPTWDNHRRIFTQMGFEVETYPYYDWKECRFDFEAMYHAIEKMHEGDVIILQTCCHNPTGLNPTYEQWKELCALIKKRRLIPFFDNAYQGFGESIEKDVAPIRLFVKEGLEVLIAASYSKNFGLYAERTGVLFTVCQDGKVAKRVGSQIKKCVRGIYSTPPCHGARIVATVLKDPKLRKLWEAELATMRCRIEETRNAFLTALKAKGLQKFEFLEKQRGMFSYTGLKQHEVDKLIAEYAIYMPGDGRVNVAGLNSENLDYVVDAIYETTKIL
ncbi:MAG: Aspartate aminotransferase [Chlamydiae bacterium]|nr:Aspartate aminotransferase [Chlamydiota bacterium]